MRFAGRVFEVGQFWAIEVPILDVASQGSTREEAFEMIVDAVESLVDKEGFLARVYPGNGDYFELGANDQNLLVAFLLRRARMRSRLSLLDVAKRLGSRSVNAYARYEQGKCMPTVDKLSQLLSAVEAHQDFVLQESRA
jgi:hypothetical protein